MRASEFITESNSNDIAFKVQKGKNKFATTLTIDNKSAGVYQYDATTGRSIAEVYPEFKGKGFGKILVLHAIYTAAKLGLDFVEDESRTAEYDNVLDSLSSNGYIVDDDGYWYVTNDGEQYLNQLLKQNVTEEAKAVKYNGLILKYAFNDNALIMKAFESGSPIAYVKFVKEDKELYPQDLWVNDDYRNKGIAKSMYDYLKSAGYIINRSHDQTKAGTGFWDKHRGEDSYVWEDQRDGIDLNSKFIPATDDIDEKLLVTASAGGKQLGRAYFINYDGDWEASDVAVDERFRGQGIAALMYDYAKEQLGSFSRSPDQTDAGEAFWDKHRPNQTVWEDEGNVQEALENWMEMESSPHDIQTILSSPESTPYKKPPNIQWLYRAIVPKNRDINSIKSTGQVIAFATDIQGAINFIRTLEITDDWVIIRKPFNPSDFLLDFTSMYEAIAQGAHSDRYVKEHEVWMKPTPEYNSAKKNEIVYSSKEYYN